MDVDNDPCCGKCGAPITTGVMAAFCPLKEDCAFYVDDIEEFMSDFKPTSTESV